MLRDSPSPSERGIISQEMTELLMRQSYVSSIPSSSTSCENGMENCIQHTLLSSPPAGTYAMLILSSPLAATLLAIVFLSEETISAEALRILPMGGASAPRSNSSETVTRLLVRIMDEGQRQLRVFSWTFPPNTSLTTSVSQSPNALMLIVTAPLISILRRFTARQLIWSASAEI